MNDNDCPKSQRVDGPFHSWTFDGDDPYIVCAYCGERRDALTGARVTIFPAHSAEEWDEVFEPWTATEVSDRL